jgi:hypothetical protein
MDAGRTAKTPRSYLGFRKAISWFSRKVILGLGGVADGTRGRGAEFAGHGLPGYALDCGRGFSQQEFSNRDFHTVWRRPKDAGCRPARLRARLSAAANKFQYRLEE